MVFILLAALPALAQEPPFIFRGGVVNAASYVANDLPGGGIAQGSIFAIFGRAIGPAAPVQVSSFPLGPQLAGVSINLRQGSKQLSAIPLFVVAGQINAILPSATPLGAVSLQVSYNGQASNWVPVNVVDHAPGVFTATGLGRGWTIFQNFLSATNQPLNSGTVSATPGQVGTLWLTGTGAISGADGDTPPVGDLPYQIDILVGGRPVTQRLYAGRAPGISGLDQFVFALPNDVPTGCFVPVYVRVNGAVSNATTMAIMPQAGSCADAHNPISAALVAGGKVVDAMLSRGAIAGGQFLGVSLDITADEASVRAMEERTGQFAFDPFLSLPPRGTCTSYTLPGNAVESGFLAAGAGRALDLGNLSVTAGTTSLPLPSIGSGLYDATLGGGFPPQPAFFDKGSLSLAASGGVDGKPFSVPVSGGSTLQGADLTPFANIVRSAGVTVGWTAQAGVSALATGAVYDAPSNSSALFECVSAAGASSMQIPDYVLAALPPTRASAGQSETHLFFGALPSMTRTVTPDQVTIFAARQDVSAVPIQSIR